MVILVSISLILFIVLIILSIINQIGTSKIYIITKLINKFFYYFKQKQNIIFSYMYYNTLCMEYNLLQTIIVPTFLDYLHL